MIATKRRKQGDQPPTLPHKLFVDYPYPILTELNRASEHQKSSDHPCALASLRWYKDCFRKMFGVLHTLHNHNPSSSIIEESFKQAHIDGRSTKTIVNDIQKKNKPSRTQQKIASAMNHHDEENKEGRVPKINMRSSNHQIDDDPG